MTTTEQTDHDQLYGLYTTTHAAAGALDVKYHTAHDEGRHSIAITTGGLQTIYLTGTYLELSDLVDRLGRAVLDVPLAGE